MADVYRDDLGREAEQHEHTVVVTVTYSIPLGSTTTPDEVNEQLQIEAEDHLRYMHKDDEWFQERGVRVISA